MEFRKLLEKEFLSDIPIHNVILHNVILFAIYLFDLFDIFEKFCRGVDVKKIQSAKWREKREWNWIPVNVMETEVCRWRKKWNFNVLKTTNEKKNDKRNEILTILCW